MTDLEHTSPTYLDSKAFKVFTQKVLKVITDAGEPITLRMVKERLGDDLNANWINDAIDALMDRDITLGSPVLRPLYRLMNDAEKAELNRRRLIDWCGQPKVNRAEVVA